MQDDKIIIETKLADGRKVYSVSSWTEQANWQMFMVALAVVIMIGLQFVLVFERFVQDDYEGVRYSILPCNDACQAKSQQQLKARQDAWDKKNGFEPAHTEESK